MIALGLFLFTYRGHPIDKSIGEWISDNALTNIGGFFAITTALIPTTCSAGDMNPICHFDSDVKLIHLISAALFLSIMGGVAYFKFTLGAVKTWNLLYRCSAIVVWVSIIGMGIYFKMETSYEYGILVGEIIALTAFGIAWLVIGKLAEMTILKSFKRFRKIKGGQ